MRGTIVHEGVGVRRTAGSGMSLGERLLALLYTWQGRLEQRALLAGYDDRLLADIGMSRAERAREVAKPFWQA